MIATDRINPRENSLKNGPQEVHETSWNFTNPICVILLSVIRPANVNRQPSVIRPANMFYCPDLFLYMAQYYIVRYVIHIAIIIVK